MKSLFLLLVILSISLSGHTQMISTDYINVKDMMAVGDGMADDTARIQAAITAAETYGGSPSCGTVFFLTDSILSLNRW